MSLVIVWGVKQHSAAEQTKLQPEYWKVRDNKMPRIIIFVLNTTQYLAAEDKYVISSKLSALQRTVNLSVCVCACLCSLSICFSVHFLISFSFFIQYQGNLAQKVRSYGL